MTKYEYADDCKTLDLLISISQCEIENNIPAYDNAIRIRTNNIKKNTDGATDNIYLLLQKDMDNFESRIDKTVKMIVEMKKYDKLHKIDNKKKYNEFEKYLKKFNTRKEKML